MRDHGLYWSRLLPQAMSREMSRAPAPLRVLLVDDDPTDALRVERTLRRGGFAPAVRPVASAEALRAALAEPGWDVLLADYQLVGLSALGALATVREMAPALPCIVVSGAIGEEAAVELMRAGARDYILKDRLGRLATAVAREVETAQQAREDAARKRQLAEAEAARAAAEAAVKARDEFISIAAHELRSPLTSLIGRLQLIERRHVQERLDRAQLANGLADLHASARRLARLVEDLLDVSRLSTGRLPLRMEPLELGPLTVDAVERARLRSLAHPFEVCVPPGLPFVQGDRDRLQQVLDNLLENAVKYSPEVGPIRVAVGVGAEDGSVRLCVRDEGIGLPDGAAEQIFEPFGRASNATRRQIPGMGLGLYLCRQIAEAHGGTLHADSDGEGRGTTLTLRLPALPRAAAGPLPG